jgi:hypothetical protein
VISCVGGAGGGSSGYTPCRTITGNPWRIDHYEWSGQYWVVFENGERVRSDIYEAIRDGKVRA